MKFVTTTFLFTFFVSAMCLRAEVDQAGDKLKAVAAYVRDANSKIITKKIIAALTADGLHPPPPPGGLGFTVSVPEAEVSRAYVILAKLIKREHLEIELIRLNKDGNKYERIEVDDVLGGKVK
jgi:hypothetical protein